MYPVIKLKGKESKTEYILETKVRNPEKNKIYR